MMKLDSSDLFLLSQCAISAAYQAGQYIAKYPRQSLDVKTKVAGNSLASQVVTEVDCLSEKIILQVLQPTCERFDLALLSEEGVDDGQRFQKDYFWSIDPLDGTLPFIESIPGYAVSIGLVSSAGIPYLGVVYDPVTQTLYHAIKGTGAFKNANPLVLNTSVATQKTSLIFITDKSFKQYPLFSKVVTELENIAKEMGYNGMELLLQGGAAMNACQVLDKMPACYFKFPKPEQGGGCIWDYAATACLFNELKTIATDIYGNALSLNASDSVFMNHCGVLYSSHQDIAQRVTDLYIRLKKQ